MLSGQLQFLLLGLLSPQAMGSVSLWQVAAGCWVASHLSVPAALLWAGLDPGLPSSCWRGATASSPFPAPGLSFTLRESSLWLPRSSFLQQILF